LTIERAVTSQIVLGLPSFVETLVVYTEGITTNVETPEALTDMSHTVAASHVMPVASAGVTTIQVMTTATTQVSAEVRVQEVTAEKTC
jgi:hypothetical protein